jgi:F0F1-type ATP synthase assembly protein I
MDNEEKQTINSAVGQGSPVLQEPHRQSTGLSLLAEVSTLAWNLVIPIVGGVLLGSYLDKRTGSQATWTLSLLVLGVFVAFGNLYNLYIEHGQQKTVKTTDEAGSEVKDAQEK